MNMSYAKKTLEYIIAGNLIKSVVMGARYQCILNLMLGYK